MPSTSDAASGRAPGLALAGIVAGPLAAVATFLVLGAGAELGTTGRITAALAVWMAVWWILEAVPLAATALLPVVVLPLAGVASLGQSAAPYASPLVFLFLGGFLIGLAVERSGLHRRLALRLLLATALVSMWISNTPPR